MKSDSFTKLFRDMQAEISLFGGNSYSKRFALLSERFREQYLREDKCPDCGTELTPFTDNDYYCRNCLEKEV